MVMEPHARLVFFIFMLLCAVTRVLKEYGHEQELNKYLTVGAPEPQQTAPAKVCVRYAGTGFDQ